MLDRKKKCWIVSDEWEILSEPDLRSRSCLLSECGSLLSERDLECGDLESLVSETPSEGTVATQSTGKTALHDGEIPAASSSRWDVPSARTRLDYLRWFRPSRFGCMMRQTFDFSKNEYVDRDAQDILRKEFGSMSFDSLLDKRVIYWLPQEMQPEVYTPLFDLPPAYRLWELRPKPLYHHPRYGAEALFTYYPDNTKNQRRPDKTKLQKCDGSVKACFVSDRKRKLDGWRCSTCHWAGRKRPPTDSDSKRNKKAAQLARKKDRDWVRREKEASLFVP